jgi:hypothetical protein
VEVASQKEPEMQSLGPHLRDVITDEITDRHGGRQTVEDLHTKATANTQAGVTTACWRCLSSMAPSVHRRSDSYDTAAWRGWGRHLTRGDDHGKRHEVLREREHKLKLNRASSSPTPLCRVLGDTLHTMQRQPLLVGLPRYHRARLSLVNSDQCAEREPQKQNVPS